MRKTAIRFSPIAFLGIAIALSGFAVEVFKSTSPAIARAQAEPKNWASPQSLKNDKSTEITPIVLNGNFIVFSPDAKSFAINVDNEAISICDSATAKVLHRLVVPRFQQPAGAAFSPDGKHLIPAWWGKSAPVSLFETATVKELRKLEDCLWAGGVFAFSPDGRIAGGRVRISNNENRTPTTLRFWHVSTGKLLTPTKNRLDGYWFGFCPDSKHLVVDQRNSKQLNVTPPPHSTFDVYREITYHLIDVSSGEDLGTVGDMLGSLNDDPFVESRTLGRICNAAGGFKVFVGPAARHILVPQPRRFWMKVAGEGTVAYWDLATGTEVHRFRDLEQTKGKRFVVASNLETVAVVGHPVSRSEVWIYDLSQKLKTARLATPKHSSKELEECWAKIGGRNELDAYYAFCAFCENPAQAMPFLIEHLKPITAPAKDEIQKLITDLDSASFAQREMAQSNLRAMNEDAIPALFEALKSSTISAEGRQRARFLIDEGISKEARQFVRAVDLLERWATPEAKKLLESLTKGTPDSWLTLEAKRVLDRVKPVEN